jgi:hypothetical protein
MVVSASKITTKNPDTATPPEVARIMETEPNSNIFKCSIPSQTFRNATYTITVYATSYPYRATCNCPAQLKKPTLCKHMLAAQDAVETYRMNRWANYQSKRILGVLA